MNTTPTRNKPTSLSSSPELLSVTTLLCAAGGLAAQTAAPVKPAPATNAPADGSQLKEVVIEAEGSVYKPERVQSPKYTEPLRDIPQTITVVPKAVIEDRGAFSLRDVLRNTPGISMQAGEGGGGLPGDSLTIRGFSSRSDWFMDGVRDYGAYNRDPFNTEQVEITKGPSSSTAGRGSTGGSINLVTKLASLENAYLLNLTGGTDNLYRSTVDVNQKLGEHTALRFNGMYHSNDTPGRNDVFQERFGIAASLAFGLDTDTRFYLNYQHMTEENMPEYGIPWVPANAFGGSGASLSGFVDQAPPVSFDNFYGNTLVDFEDVNNDMVTAIFEHDFSDDMTLRNVTRYSRTYRHSNITAPRFRDLNGGAAGTPSDSRMNRQTQRREMTNEVFSNQTNFVASFDTGPLKHALVTGLEFAWERQLNANAAATTSITDIFDPNVNGRPFAPIVAADSNASMPALAGDAESHMDTIAFYLFDTVQIGKYFELNGGLRYDHIESEARGANGATGFHKEDDLVSWKAGLVFKPVEYGSIYFGYGTSFNPTIDGNAGLGLAANAQSLDPEETRSMEFGTKWDLFEERLSITAALFQTQKTKARTTDAAGNITLAGDQEVNGVEFGIAGSITKHWQMFAGYAYMESKVNASAVANELGQVLGNTPDHSFNLWTTYNLFDERLQLGFGAQFVGDRRNGNASNSRVAPDYWTLDAMIGYRVTDNLSLRLNIYNLADERYIDRVGGGHFVPGPGRSAALTASIKF